jgi:CBS domain-containing protein
MKGSIMTEKILRRGVKAPDAYEPDILRNVSVRQLLLPVNPDAVSEYSIAASEDAGIAAELMGKYNVDTLLVKDDTATGDGRPIGIITAQALLAYYSRQRENEQHYESPTRTRRILAQGRKILRNSKIMGI